MAPRGLAASRKNKRPERDAEPVAKEDVPTDDAALTIGDLYELRQTTLELLQFCRNGMDEARLDEAQNLLRGILHGCDSLERLPEGHELRESLGLAEADSAAKLQHLQAYALHGLALVVPAASAPAAVLSGTKKRKVDPREPKTRQEWFDQALPRYESAQSLPIATFDRARCFFDQAMASNSVKDSLTGAIESVCRDVSQDDEAQESALFAIRAAVEAIDLLEDPSDRLSHLDRLDTQLKRDEWKPSFLLGLVQAELEMTRFIALEDAIEAKYRPDVELVDDETELPPLPQAQDVADAEAAAEQTLRSLRKALDEIPQDSEFRKDLTTQLWQKIEEVLDLQLAIVNADRTADRERVENDLNEAQSHLESAM